MKDVMPRVKKKMWWRCTAGCTKDGEPFSWEATVSHRTGSDRAGCPGCAAYGGSPTDQNNLLQWCQDNGEYGRKLIEEWAEPDLDMKDVMPRVKKKMSWRCTAGCTKDGEPFSWEAAVKIAPVRIVQVPGLCSLWWIADGSKQPTAVVPGQR